MKRALQGAVLLIVMVTGACLAFEDINRPPQARIELGDGNVRSPVAGDVLTLWANKSTDPEQPVSELVAEWLVLPCVIGDVDCVPLRQVLSATEPFELTLETNRPLEVVLSVTDEHGAVDRDTLPVLPANRLPVFQPAPYVATPTATGSFPLGPRLEVIAAAIDPDGNSDTVSVAGRAIGPNNPDSSGGLLMPHPDVPDTFLFVPDVTGTWIVEFEATDEDGGVSPKAAVPVVIETDQPPCIERAFPQAELVRTTDEPSALLEVLVVSDDLDPFPTPPSQDPAYGVPRFHWWVAAPASGGQFMPVEQHVASSYLVDPSAFAPGDVVSVRVEIQDRVARDVNCAADENICEQVPGCMQRFTWEVAIR